jgi:membrane protease YdiL (CAAX protease family)
MLKTSENSTLPPEKSWGFWSSCGFGIVIVLVQLIITLVTVTIFTSIRMIGQPDISYTEVVRIINENQGLLLSLSSISTAIVGVSLIILFIIMRKGFSISEYLNLRPVSPKGILISLAILLFLITVNDVIYFVFELPITPQDMVDIYDTSVYPIVFWIGIVVFTPIFEEVLFRGFLFKGFTYSRLGINGTIILTSLLWTSMHIQYGLYQLIFIFILGVYFGIVRCM